MICRGPIRQIVETSADIDWVDLTWQQTLRRALRLITRGGTQVDVLLPPRGRLRDSDVLSEGPPIIAVRVAEIEVLSIPVDDPVARARFAFDLGNRHLPAQITATTILTPDDGPARAMAADHGLPFETILARFFPEPIALDLSLRR